MTTEKDQLPKKTGQRTLVFMDGSLALGDEQKVLFDFFLLMTHINGSSTGKPDIMAMANP